MSLNLKKILNFATNALDIMNKNKITQLVVVDNNIWVNTYITS